MTPFENCSDYSFICNQLRHRCATAIMQCPIVILKTPEFD